MAFQWSRVGPVAEACRSSRVSAGRRRRQRTSAEDPSFPPVSRLLRFQSRKPSCVASADVSSNWSSSSVCPEPRQRRRDRGVVRGHAENATIQRCDVDPFAAARATERSERSASLRRGLFELLGVPPSAMPVDKTPREVDALASAAELRVSSGASAAGRAGGLGGARAPATGDDAGPTRRRRPAVTSYNTVQYLSVDKIK